MLRCLKCQMVATDRVSSTAHSYICSSCVTRMIPFEEDKPKRVSSGRPSGWHFMKEFVDKDGNVFHKGKEQKKLKGTLKPTKVKPKKKPAKRKSKQEMLLARDKEKKAALKNALKKQKDFINHKLGGI
mgnify:CR=1